MKLIRILTESEKKEAQERFKTGKGHICKEQYPYSGPSGDHAPCVSCGHEGRWHTFQNGVSTCFACDKSKGDLK